MNNNFLTNFRGQSQGGVLPSNLGATLSPNQGAAISQNQGAALNTADQEGQAQMLLEALRSALASFKSGQTDDSGSGQKSDGPVENFLNDFSKALRKVQHVDDAAKEYAVSKKAMAEQGRENYQYGWTDSNGAEHDVSVTTGPVSNAGSNQSTKTEQMGEANKDFGFTEEQAQNVWGGSNGTGTGAEVDTDTVTYTYKPGDTFGQVILDLGLDTDAGLWGSDGDVAYYTQQLIEQGMLDDRGNVKIGQPFKLRRRK